MSLSATIKASIQAAQTVTGDLGAGKFDINQAFLQALVDGVGVGGVDRMFSDERTLTASAAESLDLAGGGLTDCFGVALTFVRVKAILIIADATNTNNVVVSRPASNGLVLFAAASDALAGLTPGGLFLFVDPSAAGVAVTAATGDLLTITNSAGTTSVKYRIVILGASA